MIAFIVLVVLFYLYLLLPLKLRLYWRGLRWIRHGYCPMCNSSPPNNLCPICEGDYHYWYKNAEWSQEKADRWKARWKEWIAILK